MNNLRVYVLIDTFLPLVGGAERQAFRQSKYLRENGWEATILTMRYKQTWPPYENLEGVPVVRVAGGILSLRERVPALLRRFCYLFALLCIGWQLWKGRHDYDLVHVFQLTPFALPALLICCLVGKPLVIAMRSDPPEPGIGKQRVRTGADLETFERLGKLILYLLNRQLRRTGAYITVLSAHMRTSLARCGLHGAKIVFIPNGVDTEHFQPSSWTEQRSVRVVCVAKLRYQKGIDLLLRAWSILLKQFPEARLVIAGDGPLLERLQRLANELGIAATVEFTGLCTDVVHQYQRGQIAVLPSRWEGMPNTLLEAMACGLACVATRVSGSQDLLDANRYGLLIEPEDVEGLAQALLLLLRDAELARGYGLLARRRVEQNYVFDSIMQRYMNLYRSIVSRCLKARKSS